MRLVVAVLLLVALTACTSGPSSVPASGPSTDSGQASSAPVTSAVPTPTPETTPPETTPPPARGKLRFDKIATLEQPVAFAVRTGDDRLYVAEQTGRLRTTAGETVIDLSREVSTGNEQGLLGVAFHPTGRWVYLDWTDARGTTHITEWAYDGTRATARRDVLTQKQPFANHNGGQLAFGPDGLLYIAFGDGGSAGDPQGNGQNLGTLLGKILRIDPRGKPYTIPRDNPFVGKEGARPEIWAYGLRNPWRFTFDRDTGDLWIGDVGQNELEEVNYQPAGSEGGENYGWNLREGDRPFRGRANPRDLVEPVIVYPLGEGGNCSVIAGYVYRGEKNPWLQGQFLYGDFCAGWIKAAPMDELGEAAEVGEVEQLSSFGQGPDGELYALSLRGPIYRIVPA
ncbi:PQQ-dependent sugar dehydrogenase [Nonomuraea fuscirosea]|uniref:PQQ-dependent sugar dehydrogenase n=1 Tax=Nonomuraea fuscirosea TaxID=1291556 RepID=UPI002DDBAA12|nr:PQQ-dependent sugar dehydrogenase [Nonomuraea fuscirosea]WSA54681.1 PQQ-dependent sugar dehydrogenase [Nonomuraea fuscirosea]